MKVKSEQRQGKIGISRYLGIYAALWKNSVTRETMFKGNFLLWIVVEILWFALQLSEFGWRVSLRRYTSASS